MSTSVPDGISFSDLQDLAKEAPKETEPAETLFCGKTYAELQELADKTFQDMINECGHPLLGKMLMLHINNSFLEWHSQMGHENSQQGEHKAAICWLRDAGKFQAIANILLTVSMGDGDTLVSDD